MFKVKDIKYKYEMTSRFQATCKPNEVKTLHIFQFIILLKLQEEKKVELFFE